jgi:hypothetical protein
VTGDPQTALTLLGEAVDLGFGEPTLLDENDDFEVLRAAPGWAALVARAQQATRRPSPP